MKKKEISFQEMISRMIKHLHAEKRWGTAQIYESTLKSLNEYSKGSGIAVRKVTPKLLMRYQEYLRGKGLGWNTISTFMRICRAAYNKAADMGYAKTSPRMFHNVFTGVISERKTSIGAENMKKILEFNENESSRLTPKQRKALKIFCLLFLLRGMPFVDYAYIKKSDLGNGILIYRRKKTGVQLHVKLTSEAMKLVKELSADTRKESPYLFDIIHFKDGSIQANQEYRVRLRGMNSSLKELSKIIGIVVNLSTYSARHTWATMAYHCGVIPGVISQSLGHASIKTTEIYLNPFRNEVLDSANEQMIEFTKR